MYRLISQSACPFHLNICEQSFTKAETKRTGNGCQKDQDFSHLVSIRPTDTDTLGHYMTPLKLSEEKFSLLIRRVDTLI